MSSRRIAEAALICSACAVSTTSLEVRPKCSQRDSGPTFSATAVVKAITSCFTSASISWMRSTSKPPRSRMAFAASTGTMPSSARTLAGCGLDFQPDAIFVFVAPDAAHGRSGITSDQCEAPPENLSFYLAAWRKERCTSLWPTLLKGAIRCRRRTHTEPKQAGSAGPRRELRRYEIQLLVSQRGSDPVSRCRRGAGRPTAPVANHRPTGGS